MNPRAASRLAVAVVLATPLLTIFAHGVAPVLLALAACLLAFASWRAGCSEPVLAALREGAMSLPGLLAVALLVLMTTSLAWTPAPARGGEHVLHTAGSLALFGIAAANARVLAPRPSAVAATLVLLIASVIVTLDNVWMGWLRGLLGLSTNVHRLNRAALFLALALPLVTALLWAGRRPVLMAVVWAACVFAIFRSQSASAQLGVIVAAATFVLALAAPVATTRLVAVVAAAATLAIPFVAPAINDLVPAAIHDAVGRGSLTVRGEIWSEYAALVFERPWFGFGVEASHVGADLPQAAVLTEAERALLSFGHPHNAALQIWFELGALGVALAIALLGAVVRAVERTAGSLLPAATATVAGAYAVAVVSHGVWQAWWWCMLGLIAVLFVAASADMRKAGRR